jgi:RNA polymerase sigma-70 factor (ECF subfamily)
MQLDDAAAVAQARAGDEEAFRVLVERHSRGVFRLAYRMTGKPEDAEDVVQETFVRAFRQLARFEARSNFSTWLYRIGFNCAIDYMRARPHRETAETMETLEARAQHTTKAPSMDDLVYAGEISARVQQALVSLTDQERAAFLMRHYHGCSIDEIGGELGLKTNAAKHAVFRAVKKMRVALRPFVDAQATVTTER